MASQRDPMSRSVLDTYFKQYFSELTLMSQGLAKKFFYLLEDLAEDPFNAAIMLLHDAYVEAASHTCHFDPEQASFRSWFLGIMYHILRRKQRMLAQKRWQPLAISTLPLLDEERDEQLAGCDQLDSSFFRISNNPEYYCMVHDQVEGFLSLLDAQDRRIIELYFFEGWRGTEIAQTLNWSLSHFHMHLQTIFRHLRIITQERLKDWECNKQTLHGSSKERGKSSFSAF